MPRNYLTVIGLSAVLILTGAPGIFASVTFTVTKAADTADNICDSDCSIRDAVAAANASAEAVKIIDFLPSLAGSTIVLSSGEIALTSSVEIRGPGADKLTISGNNASRIFYLPAGSGAAISGMTLMNGNGAGAQVGSTAGGGAIRAEGSLTLDGVYLTGNSLQSGEGSAVYFRLGGAAKNSTVAFNSGTAFSIGASAILQVYNSTFTGNGGSAMHFTGATVKMRNSTVTDSIEIGGLGALDSGNSIIGTVRRLSNLGGFTSAGKNIIISPATTGLGVTYGATDMLNVDPLTGSLQNNGGRTLTLALQPGSPAIDAGNNALAAEANLLLDQRGYMRYLDGNGDNLTVVDIGAYEYGSAAPMPIQFGGRVTGPNGAGVGRAAVSITDSLGHPQTAITSPLGYFNFQNVSSGYVSVNVSAKGHRFTPAILFPAQNTDNAELIVQ